jgi:hypothetical protein
MCGVNGTVILQLVDITCLKKMKPDKDFEKISKRKTGKAKSFCLKNLCIQYVAFSEHTVIEISIKFSVSDTQVQFFQINNV